MRREEVAAFVRNITDDELGAAGTDLGGHDLDAMLDAYRQCDEVTDRPSIVFAYTVKGWGLPIAGNPRNHSALLTDDRSTRSAPRSAWTPTTEWDRLDPRLAGGLWVSARREALTRPPREAAAADHGARVDRRARGQADRHPGGVRPGARRPAPATTTCAVPRDHRA